MIDKVYSWDLNKFIETINALVEESNVHERQIDELQMKVEPEKCEPAAKNAPKWIHWDNDEVQRYGAIARGFKSLRKEPADPYAQLSKWIGKLCRFWDKKEEEKVFGILTTIDSDCGLSDMCPYWNDTTKNWFEHCEPVKPDDDIIYKGGDRALEQIKELEQKG